MPTILALLSNPDDEIKLRSDREIKEINKMISNKAVNDFFCTTYQAVTLEELPSILLNNQPDIIHFSGHGNKNSLSFESNQGTIQKVSLHVLKPIFEECGNKIICMFLSACSSHLIAQEMSKIIPYVISFPHEIEDEKAIIFSKVFYEMLVLGQTFVSSYNIAKSILSNEIEEKKRLPLLIENTNLSNHRYTIYNPSVITAQFIINKKGKIEGTDDGYNFNIDVKNLPSNATQIIYEFIDADLDENYRFQNVENLVSGTACKYYVRGNIVIRAWIWIESQRKGFAVYSSLIGALDHFYNKKIPNDLLDTYNIVKSN